MASLVIQPVYRSCIEIHVLLTIFKADFLGTQNDTATSPITGAWFRMEQGPESTPPTYEYDEVGVVVEGEFINFREAGIQKLICIQGSSILKMGLASHELSGRVMFSSSLVAVQ